MCMFSAPKMPPPPPPPPPLADPSTIKAPDMVDNAAQKTKKKGRAQLRTDTGSGTANIYSGNSGLNIPN